MSTTKPEGAVMHFCHKLFQIMFKKNSSEEALETKADLKMKKKRYMVMQTGNTYQCQG